MAQQPFNLFNVRPVSARLPVFTLAQMGQANKTLGFDPARFGVGMAGRIAGGLLSSFQGMAPSRTQSLKRRLAKRSRDLASLREAQLGRSGLSGLFNNGR